MWWLFRELFVLQKDTRAHITRGLKILYIFDRNLRVYLRFDIIVSFRKSLLDDETFHWAYARLIIFAGHKSVQLELVRNQQLRQRFPFLDMLLDDDNWARKLYSLQYLGDSMRFVALVRTVLQGEITQRNVLSGMSIDQGLEMIVDIVTEKAVILHRAPRTARSVPRSRDGSFRQLQAVKRTCGTNLVR